jgi:hypothetical protein
MKNKLKQSTIKKYNVKQICKHLNQFQLSHDINLYRFDFAYNAIYKKYNFGRDYIFLTTINDKNKDDVIDILSDIYSLIYYI